MTDHVSGFVVVLAKDLRDDDAESTLSALRHVRGVIAVKPVVADPSLVIERSRVTLEVTEKLYGLIEDLRG